MFKESREKLVEKNIKWKQAYTDKTAFLKEQFEATVGPGSYFRFEGKAPNGDGYYCIVGPAKVHAPRAKFFAGVRKLPATYSAGGKYFDSLDTAARYARETWGVPTPKELKPYTSRQLMGLAGRVDKWKAQRDEEDAKKEEKEKKKDEKEKKKSEDFSIIEKHSDTYSFNIEDLTKEAMAYVPQVSRRNYEWQTYETIVSGGCERYNQLVKDNPSFAYVLNEIRDEKRKRYAIYHRKYGFDEEKLRDIFRVYVGYSVDHGLYAIYIGPYMMPPKYLDDFYNGLEAMGFYVDKGTNVPDDILKQVLLAGNSKMNRLAGLYYADTSGKFKTFQKAYPLPKAFRAREELKKATEVQGLDRYEGLPVRHQNEQIESLQTTGAPLAQGMSLEDYSYIFNYNGRYSNKDENGKAPKGKLNWFYRKFDGPNGITRRPLTLPANSEKDDLAQIFSFDQFEKAQQKDMVISATGTRIFLNRDGFRKALTNMFAQHPEYNEDLLDYARVNASLERKLGKKARDIVTENFSNFLYFLTGIGHMSDQDKHALNLLRPNIIVDGVVNLDDVGQNGPVYNCGAKVYSETLKGCLDKFYKSMFELELDEVAPHSEEDDQLRTKFFDIFSTLNLRNTKKKTFSQGPAKKEWEKKKKPLPSGFMVPRIALTNESNIISAKSKNEWKLLSEVAKIMSVANIESVDVQSVPVVAKLLNSGSFAEKGMSQERVQARNGMFNVSNVAPIMRKVLEQRPLVGEKATIKDIAKFIKNKFFDMQIIYTNERNNAHSKQLKEQLEDEEELSEDLELVWNEELGSFNLGEKRNLKWDKGTGSFMAYGVHDSFHEVFEYVRDLTEGMALKDDDEKLVDPVTRVVLLPTDENGNPIRFRIPPIFKNFPSTNTSSQELEQIFTNRTPYDQALYRLSRSDEEMYEIFQEKFGIANMRVINRNDYDYQIRSHEVTEEIENQPAEESEDFIGSIDSEVEELESDPTEEFPIEDKNEEEVQEVAPVVEQQPVQQPAVQQPVKSPLDILYDEDFDLDKFDIEEYNKNASNNVIRNIISLSKELDDEGKSNDSLELLKLAKKFSSKFKKGN